MAKWVTFIMVSLYICTNQWQNKVSNQSSMKKFLTSLPKVGIVYGYANCSPIPMQAFVDAKYDGIVLAGVGDGNFYKDVF